MAKSKRPCARKDAIRVLREAKGWGQQALADRAVVSIKTINSIEQGKPAQLSTFAKVAKALGVEPSAFLDGHETSPAINPEDGQSRKRVEVTLTLSIPFEDFDETDGLDRLADLITSLMNAQNAVTIAGLSPGSIEVKMLVDEEDAPRLLQAFSQRKLDVIQAVELDLPRSTLLHFLTSSVAHGATNPIVLALIPFIGIWFLLDHLKKSGIRAELSAGDHVRLKKASAPSTLAASKAMVGDSVASFDPASLREIIEVVTPPYLAPSFPCEIALLLQSNDEGGLDSANLGEQLESSLKQCEPLRDKVSRVAPGPAWTGELSLQLDSLNDQRAMTEVVISGFFGKEVTMTAKRSGTFLGGTFTMESKTNLSASVWDSLAKEVGNALEQS